MRVRQSNLTGIWHSLRAHTAHLQPPWVPVMFLARPKLSEQQPKRGSQLTFHSQRVVFVDIIPVPAVCSIPHTNINKVLFDEELQSSHYNNISDWWRLRNGCRYTRVMSVLSKKKKEQQKKLRYPTATAFMADSLPYSILFFVSSAYSITKFIWLKINRAM